MITSPDEHARVGCGGRPWTVAAVDEAVAATLQQTTAVPSVIARLLWLRGIRTTEQALQFLHPSADQLHSSSLLCGMQAAVDRIARAVRDREPILIYGDYDVDGTLATVLLKTAIDRVTPKASPSLVRYHIPHRVREGYGIQAEVLTTAAAAGVRLVISVDTGIRAFAAAAEAEALGLDLIVTDHHLPDESGLPRAIAVLNPNQPDCQYPEKHLCGAAVAWKLADALLLASQHRPELQLVDDASLRKLQRSLLKLVAIATVADAVPLTGENRVLVSLGLAELSDVRQPGLRALFRLAQVGTTSRPPLASEIAFRVAPRINAAGRMDIARDVVDLLLTRDTMEAESLAAKLHALNEERRSVEATILLDLQQQVDLLLTDADAETPGVFVLDGEGWHRGVIGILASRVVDRTNRPALVITHHEGAAHGSGRSAGGFHLLDAIAAVHTQHQAEEQETLFLRFGGHAQAVGFSLPSAMVPALRRRMLAHAAGRALAEPPPAIPVLHIDAELPMHLATYEIWRWLCTLEPFGNGNAEPVFLARAVRVLEMQPLKQRHLKLRVQAAQGPVTQCLCWARSFDWPDRVAQQGITPGVAVDVAYQIRWNERPDFSGLEIHVCDLRKAVQEGPVTDGNQSF